MQIEFPENLASVKRAGWGITVSSKSGMSNVFHFPIPTPVIINDQRLKVGSVMLQFTTGSGDAVVRKIIINDGKNLLKSYENVNLSGKVGWKRFDVPNHPSAQLGIDIIVHVRFGVESSDHSMTFEAAGCDFLPP
nr:DUF6623 family protein [Methanobacterium veterum]